MSRRKRASLTPETAARAITPESILSDILNIPDLAEIPVVLAPIEMIDPNPYQTRRHFDPEKLTELATAMQAQGFLGGLVAREVEGRYQLAFGERRLRAARQAGIDQIPLHVHTFTDVQMMEVAITENVNREDLTPIEEAEGYEHLHNTGYSYRRIAERVGKSATHISMLLSLLKQPDVKEAVEQGRINASEAYEITKVEDEEIRQTLINQLARDQLTRTALREAVRLAISRAGSAAAQEASSRPAEGASLLPTPPLNLYDPVPNLKASVNQLKNIRPDRFQDIPGHRLGDVLDLLDEIAYRASSLKAQLGE